MTEYIAVWLFGVLTGIVATIIFAVLYYEWRQRNGKKR